MIKMIATDIDGTILKYNFEFNSEVKDCIKRLKKSGIKVVLVTGRMHSCTTFIAEELGISDMPVISYQGGMIVENNNIIYEKNLDAESARKILDWAKQNQVHVNLYMNDMLFVKEENEIIQRYAQERKTTFNVVDFDNIKLEKINKILVIDFNDANVVTEYQKFLSGQYPNLHIVKSTPYFCEICHNEATKKNAVNYLKSYWNLQNDEVLTIGDQNNDISLLQAGGIAVAMGNATEELKKYANYVTDTVDNNGFVKAVEKFIFTEGLQNV